MVAFLTQEQDEGTHGSEEVSKTVGQLTAGKRSFTLTIYTDRLLSAAIEVKKKLRIIRNLNKIVDRICLGCFF